MRRWFVHFVIVVGTFSAQFSMGAEKLKIDFEWEDIPGAKQIEVELYSKDKNLVQRIFSPSSSLSAQMEPGYYFVRGRVYDYRMAKGEWSELKEFLVPPKKIESVEAPSQVQVDLETSVAVLNLKWGRAPGAHEYKIIVLDGDGKIVGTKTTTSLAVALKLKAGVYSYKVIPYTKDGVEGEAFEAPQMLSVKARPIPEISEPTINFVESKKNISWKKEAPLPTIVRLEYQKHFGTKWKEVAKVEVTQSQWEVPADLSPGKYRASFWNRNRAGEVSGIKLLEFVVKPQDQDLPPADISN